ncbi:uncharacterized protein DI49_1800 [Saccharomyces eubayanus]|uniref:uncharacterized protein n=1 Tax=Saccharomyces eubayanus TaxID=1080349 RepID=UPI0006BEE180|nr:hypothetical protein DI49_1800 [Saccharomyces eubayanus]KOG99350.1 hypothetical protein DI49_1800 [Saccharomyces eubayanus]
MAPNLPGFYYDEERRRYFRISDNRTVSIAGSASQYSKESIKRQSVQAGYDKQYLVIKNKRRQTLENYRASLLNPLERAFRSSSYKKHNDGLKLQDAFASWSKDSVQSHRPVSAELLNFPNRMLIGALANHILLITKEGYFQDKIAFSTTRGYVAGFSSLNDYSQERFFVTFSMIEFNPELKYKSELTDVFKTLKLERIDTTKEGLSRYLYHNINSRSNVHTFVIFIQGVLSPQVFKVRQVKLKENDRVHDSLVVGDTLVISVNDSLHFYNLVPEVLPKPFIFFPVQGSGKSKNRSDITSLSFCLQEVASTSRSKKPKSGALYMGFRSGNAAVTVVKDIEYTAMLQSFKVNAKEAKRKSLFIDTALKSVVSIRSLNKKGLIIISGMADKENAQRLVIVDTFLEDTLTKKSVVSFRTKFLNVTKDTELFKVSGDGHYFIYGSTSARDGKGDFEVFCTTLSGNLNYERLANGNITMYPIREMRDYCRSEGSEFKFIHLHSAFIAPRAVKMSKATGTAIKPATVLSHYISEDVFSEEISFLIRREDSPYNGENILITSTLA